MSNILSGWVKTNIGKLTKTNSVFSDGDWVESKDQDESGQYRLIQLADVGDGAFVNKSSRFMNEEQFNRLKCTPLQKGDILIARMPDPLGRACIFPLEGGKFATVVDVALIRTENADHYWLMSAINSSDFRFQIDLNASGTTRTRIARGALSQIPLIAPPLPEQQKIAAILTSVDEVIESTQAQINKLKDLKTGMMQELLTKGIGRDGLPHTEFKDSPVGRIPKEWEALRLKKIALQIRDGNYGADYPTAAEMLDSGIPFLTSAVIGNDQNIIYKKIKYISKEKHKQLAKAHIKTDDVLFTNRGANVGNVALVPSDLDDANIGPQLTFVRVNQDFISPLFLLIAMQSEYFKVQLTQQDSGSAMNFFGIGTTENFVFAVPPHIEQDKIAFAINSVNEKIIRLDSKLEALKNTKKALMQDLLTGKVRVKVN